MRKIKIIGILGLVMGVATLSQAGFRDALKSAAGGALNEITGANQASGQSSAEEAKGLTPAPAKKAASAEMKNCEVKDASSSTRESFMTANDFSEAEYLQWSSEVKRQLAGYQNSGGDKWMLVSGMPSDGVVVGQIRIRLPSDEAEKVFCIIENDGILLAQEYAYILSGAILIKFNYTTLVSGNCDERGDVMRNPEAGRVIYAIEKCCASAKQQISSEKWRQTRLAEERAAQLEREKQAAADEKDRKEREARDMAEKEKEAQEQKVLRAQAQAKTDAILAWDDSLAQKRAADMKKKTVVFKALYLGMPAEDAYKIIYRAANRTIMSQLGGHDANDIYARGSISKEITMNDKIYEFIGDLAIALYSKKITISLSSLNQILSDNKLDNYGSNRGLAAGVAAAYRYWGEKDPVVHHAIAYTYRDRDGDLAWDK